MYDFASSSSETLASLTTLPAAHHSDASLPIFASIQDVLQNYRGDDAIYVLYPHKISTAAELFLNGFPGRVLYAVKANPHPAVLKTLWATGLRDFDVASLREVEDIHALLPDARLYMMHPVKSRQTIAKSYALGVRDFAFDCHEELVKIIEETKNAKDLHLHLRLALPKGDAVMPLDGKYGAPQNEASDLLKQARTIAASLGVTFHVGSQCLHIDNYTKAISYTCDIIKRANVKIDSMDIGGGFPTAYPGMTPPPMTDYFDTIKAAIHDFGLQDLEIIGEPGRALCAEGGSTLARIDLRKENDLFLNDGSYGSLFDAAQCDWTFPVILHTNKDPVPMNVTAQGFRLFGPTCDSLDVMANRFTLPASTKEGDWIEFAHLGAYGQAMATRFNGFYSETTVAVIS